MSIQKIVDYVMHTPHNTNPAILKQVINDNISWNDLKDKPFYTETETFTLLENGRVSSFNPDEDAPTDFPVERVFAIGDVVNIVWNGKEYTGTARHFDGDIGVSVYPEDSGEGGIYIFTYDDGGQPYCVVYSYVSGTLSVTVTREIVHAIDPKYLVSYDGVFLCTNIPLHATMDDVQIQEIAPIEDLKAKFANGEELNFLLVNEFSYGGIYEARYRSACCQYNSSKQYFNIMFVTQRAPQDNTGGTTHLHITFGENPDGNGVAIFDFFNE